MNETIEQSTRGIFIDKENIFTLWQFRGRCDIESKSKKLYDMSKLK